MNVKHCLYIASCFLLLFLNSSCTKSKLTKFEQTWQLLDISNSLPPGSIELWDFTEGTFNRIRYSVSTGNDTIDAGTYKLNAGVLKTNVTIKNCFDNEYNNEWKINKLDREMLVMFSKKEGAFLYKEFVKF